METDKQMLISSITSIIADYDDNTDIIPFYRKLCVINDDIRINISNEVFKEFKTEHQCIYYEMIYGDTQEDADIVVNDCINILEKIVKVISTTG